MHRTTYRVLPLLLMAALGTGAAHTETLKLTVTGYCGGPCKACGTRGRTNRDKDASGPGAAINRSAAIPALRRARAARFMTSRGGWSRWYRIDDTGSGPRRRSLRSRWIDFRVGHPLADRLGQSQKTVQLR